MGRKTKFAIELGLNDIKVKQLKLDGQGDYHIFVSCTARSTFCPKCHQKLSKTHGHCEETIIEHLPIFDKSVFLHVKWPRFMCTDCDSTSSFHPEWLNESGKMTTDYENYILKSLLNSTIKDVAEKQRITENIIEGVVKRRIHLEADWEKICPKVIGFDEIALRKGHKQYLTIVSDLSVPGKIQVLAVLKGRTTDELMPFLNQIPDEILLNLQSICIDMGASYFSALKKRINDDKIFNRIVTVDRFHVAKLVGGKVDAERKKLANELKEKWKDEEENLKAVKGSMWPFRHHPKSLNPEQELQLQELFELSPDLKKCYELRESLYQIFETHLSKEEGKEKIESWLEKAKNVKAFQSFIDTYHKFEANILNYFTHRHSSGPVEGLNNKIKVIKRRGFGFRNIVNFSRRVFLDVNYKQQLIGNPVSL